MKNLHVGALVISISLAILFISWSYSSTLIYIVESSCTHGAACPMHAAFTNQNIVSIILILILMGVGAFIIINDYWSRAERLKKLKTTLGPDDKKVYDYLIKKGQHSPQTNLISELGLTKVRATRILNRMEKKGIIERKREGMHNIVVLKVKLVS